MAVADHGGRSCPNQHHGQPSGQDAGMDGGESFLLPEEGTVLPGWNQGKPADLGIHATVTCSITSQFITRLAFEWCTTVELVGQLTLPSHS